MLATLTWFDFYGLGGIRTLLAYGCDDIYRLPRSLGLTQPSWWRASASLRSRSVWLVHRNINICLYINMWWKIQTNCWRLERSGWQRGRILTSLISRWQELPGGSMAGFTLFNTNIVEIFNIFLSFSLCYAQKGWHAVKLSIDEFHNKGVQLPGWAVQRDSGGWHHGDQIEILMAFYIISQNLMFPSLRKKLSSLVFLTLPALRYSLSMGLSIFLN